MTLPRLSSKEAVIMKLLVSEPSGMYGLEMVRASPALKRGTVYTTLARMVEKDLLTSEQEPRGEEGGLPRRIFKLTGHGWRVSEAHRAAAEVMEGEEAWAR